MCDGERNRYENKQKACVVQMRIANTRLIVCCKQMFYDLRYCLHIAESPKKRTGLNWVITANMPNNKRSFSKKFSHQRQNLSQNITT